MATTTRLVLPLPSLLLSSAVVIIAQQSDDDFDAGRQREDSRTVKGRLCRRQHRDEAKTKKIKTQKQKQRMSF